MLSVLVIANNYLHDVATAVALSSLVLLEVFRRRARNGEVADVGLLRTAYPLLTTSALVSVVWIIVGGVPRTIFFSRFEWDPARIPGLVAALGVKHGLMFGTVAFGVLAWRRAKGLIAEAGAGS